MKIFSLLKTIVYPACFYFTIVTFLLSIIGTISSQTTILPKSSNLGLFFLFSLFMAIMNKILFIKAFNTVIRISLHFIGSFSSFFIVFMFCSGYYKNVSSTIFISILFIVLYAVIFTIIFSTRYFFERKKTENSAYKTQFDKLKK